MTSAFPAIKEAILNKYTSALEIAYIDLCLENNRKILIGGPHYARAPAVNFVKELASQHGKIYNVRTANTLLGILCDETPFRENDYVAVNLDLPEKGLSEAYFRLINSGKVRGIAEMRGEMPAQHIISFEKEEQISRMSFANNLDLCIYALKLNQLGYKITSIVEVIGLDAETNEVAVNEVFKFYPTTDEPEFSGKSYYLEKIMAQNVLSKEQIMAELKARKEKFENIAKTE